MQNISVPLNLAEINFENIVYKDTKSNSRKTVVFLKYKKKNTLKDFVIQTPTFLNIEEPVKNRNHWDLDIPLVGKKENKINNFINFLKNLDEKIIYDAKLHSSNWFKNYNVDMINYQKLIRSVDDNKYNKKIVQNGMFRIKLLNNNDFKTSIQLNNSENISIDKIPKNSWVKMILEIQAIWINNTGIGLFFKPILVSFTPIAIQTYKFLEESDEEIEDVIDTENDIFLKSGKISDNNIESSNLRIQDSLEVNTKCKYSSTSSDEKKSKSSNDNKNDVI